LRNGWSVAAIEVKAEVCGRVRGSARPGQTAAGAVVARQSFAALERAVTEGAFWLLADAAEAEGRRREDFTAPFGAVFERFAQESLERVAALDSDSPTPLRDFQYGPRSRRVLSSDMTFLCKDEEAVFFEVVTGRPRVATLTRGDPVTFREDVRRLVLKKAAQLRRCWEDHTFYRRLRFEDYDPPRRTRRVWPVLLTIESFPLMPPLYGEIVDRIRADGWPRTAPPITILDADELAALERLVEQGWTTLEVLTRWKREAPRLPISNWLASVEPQLGHAEWHRASFAAMTRAATLLMFGRSIDVQDL
jgi:hypothetical protein